VASVTVAPDSSDVTTGGTKQLAATAKDAAGNILSGRLTIWSSSDATVATVSGGGLVTAVLPGRAVITAAAEGRSGTAVVRVVPPIDTFPGAANAAAVTIVPLREAQVRTDDYATGSAELPGLPLSFNTVNVSIEPNATLAALNAMLAQTQAQVLGGAPGVPGQIPAILVLRFATRSHAELAPVLAALRQSPVVKNASPDAMLDSFVIPGSSVAPGGPAQWTWDLQRLGTNWSLEYIRAPQMWNLNSLVRTRVPTGVADDGFAAHEDLVMTATFTGALFDPSAVNHGTHVAGTVGATFGNGRGVDGVTPFADLVGQNGIRSTAQLVTGLASLMSARPDLRVINLSLGYNWSQRTPPIDTDTDVAARNTASVDGGYIAAVLATHEALGRALPVIVAAAGNDSNAGLGDQEAVYASPYNNAALAHGSAPIVVVEALSHLSGGTRASFSNVGGHVSAPGVAIMSTLPGNAYGLLSGTSMATPHVTGLVSYLYALDPSLPAPSMTSNPVRDLLISQGIPVFGTAAPMIDGFATAMDVDRLMGSRRMLRALVDIDDGTPDGNTRVAADGSVVTTNDADGNGGPGDGSVDMSDFRRWRDWVLEIESDPGLLLDGAFDHPKRDLNGDRLVDNLSTESVFPRGDFNGDGELHRGKRAKVPGVLTGQMLSDLEVLQAEFLDPDYDAASLPALIDSGDLTIHPVKCLQLPGVAQVVTSVSLQGAPAPLDSRTHTAGQPVQVYTVAPNVAGYKVRLDAFDAAGTTLIGSAEENMQVLLGEDIHWNPTCLDVDLSVIFPQTVQPGVATPVDIRAGERDPTTGVVTFKGGIVIHILVAGGSVSPDTGLTDPQGRFTPHATLTAGSQKITITVTATLAVGPSRTVIVEAASDVPVDPMPTTWAGSVTFPNDPGRVVLASASVTPAPAHAGVTYFLRIFANQAFGSTVVCSVNLVGGQPVLVQGECGGGSPPPPYSMVSGSISFTQIVISFSNGFPMQNAIVTLTPFVEPP
jgi:hypothetical protein